jgi:hypothetical protein
MRIGIRQAVSWTAIYAIALRAILLGVTPVVVGGAVAGDPLSIICHSDGPSQSCEHCNLCSAVTAPAAPDGLLGTILPSQVAHAVPPTSSTPRIDHQSDAKLARKPPLFA